ncbi:hypothetical protein Q7P37_004660 [Cladosporium fusiforme]
MARTRRSSRPQLTESWDNVDDQDFASEIYAPGDEREELGDSYALDGRPRRSGSRTKANLDNHDEGDVSAEAAQNAMHNSGSDIKARKRGEPGLVMPASPDGLRARKASISRAKTPHSRMNQRSLTSDAGSFLRGAQEAEKASHRSQNKAEYDEEIDNTSDLNWPFMIWEKVLVPVLWYMWDILRIAVTNPLTKSLLAIWLVVGVVMLVGNFLNHTVSNALSPLCRIPGSSFLNLPFCPIDYIPELSGPAEFDKLVDAQSHFEEVLAASATGAFLPLEMKSSESGIRDLKHVVEHSALPSRNELVFEFNGFIDTARKASHSLSRFNSRIGRAVDHILSTNRWTLQVIDGVAADDAARGTIGKWASKNLNIFAPFQPVALSRNVLLDQYLRHTNAVEDQILTLITEAHALLEVLDNLDNRLDLIASIATRDGIQVENGKDELLAQLWTKLGGRRSSVAKLDKQLTLLRDVGNYRRMAWAHVNGAAVKLMAIRDNLEDLRERVAMPDTLGDVIPLEVHIQNINLGIERLEQQRDAGRKLEADRLASITGRADMKATMIDNGEL